jgi:hypothetical protein
MNPKQIYYQTQAETIIKNLRKRNMEGFYCATAAEAKEKALGLIVEGETVSFGRSNQISSAGRNWMKMAIPSSLSQWATW